MQRYFTLQIFECFDKTLGHSEKWNAISLCKYLSALIKHWGTQKMQRYFTLQIFECFDKTLGHSKKCNVISLCNYLSALIYLLTTCGLRSTYLMVCACVDACTHFFAGTQFYALHIQPKISFTPNLGPVL